MNGDQFSETGRIRFRRVRFQTPNSESFFALTEFRGESSVSSSRPTMCVTKGTHRVFRRAHRVCPRTRWGPASSLLRNSTLETVFRLFPKFREINTSEIVRVWGSPPVYNFFQEAMAVLISKVQMSRTLMFIITPLPPPQKKKHKVPIFRRHV